MSPMSGIAVFPYRGQRGVPLFRPAQTGLFHDVFMVRRSVFDAIGTFDQVGFPIYLSEADFAERMSLRGFKAFLIPTSRVWHDVPVLRGARNILRHTHITEPRRAYYVARNRMLFVKRYRGLWQRLIFLSFFVPASALFHLVAILSTKGEDRIYLARFYLGGIIAGLRLR
jgi:hypothetical protein